jgi:hypothetical protein
VHAPLPEHEPPPGHTGMVHEEPTQLADAHTHVLLEHEPLGAAQDGEQPPTTDCSQLVPKKVVLPTVLHEQTALPDDRSQKPCPVPSLQPPGQSF